MTATIRSFLLQIATVENIQAVEDCELLSTFNLYPMP